MSAIVVTVLTGLLLGHTEHITEYSPVVRASETVHEEIDTIVDTEYRPCYYERFTVPLDDIRAFWIEGLQVLTEPYDEIGNIEAYETRGDGQNSHSEFDAYLAFSEHIPHSSLAEIVARYQLFEHEEVKNSNQDQRDRGNQ